MPTGSMTAARNDNTLTLLPNGRVLAVSGRGLNETPDFTADLYDPCTGAWTATGLMTVDRYGHTATPLNNGTVLVAGGYSISTSSVLSSAEVYIPSRNTWAGIEPMNTPRDYHTATLFTSGPLKGRVLVAGGCTAPSCTSVTADAELYNPTMGTWKATGSMTTPRGGQTATLLPNGDVLVAGGCNGNSCTTVLSNAELYDPRTGTWHATGSMVTGRIQHTATLLPNGMVLVAGGCSTYLAVALACSSSLSSAELYDPRTGTWMATGSMTTARARHTATLLPNGKVLVAGGYANCCPGPANNTAEVYDPRTGTWTPTASLHTERSDYGAILLNNGQVLVAGGATTPGVANTVLASAELYRLLPK